MDKETELLRLLSEQTSPDNNIRTAAELEFNRQAAQDPSGVAYGLIVSAAARKERISLDVRQSCLLHLKRLVPKFWSMGFPAFIGPPIDQELKSMIRQQLIELATTSTESKIRLGSAYAIVQIAAADYPDEWPDLLGQLYEHTTNLKDPTAVRGGLAVLTDLFDDLITEDQFWEGGVGNQLITHITHLLGQQVLPDLKTSALKLYLTVFNTLLSAEALNLKERRASVISHIIFLSELLLDLLRKLISQAMSADSCALVELTYKSYLYKVYTNLLSNFSKHVAQPVKSALLYAIVEDLAYASNLYRVVLVEENNSVQILKTEELDDPERCIVDFTSEVLNTLSVLQHTTPLSQNLDSTQLSSFISALTQCSILPQRMIEEYVADFNTYVTDVTGLSPHVSVRDSIADFLTDLNDKDASNIFDAIQAACVDVSLEWRMKEAYLFLAESLFLNEEAESIGSGLSLASYLSNINALIPVEIGPSNHPLVIARVFLLLPRFMEKFNLKISVGSFGNSGFLNTITYAATSCNDDSFDLVKASALVSATLWNNVPGFELSALNDQLQDFIFNITYSLLEDSEEDTLPVLLEATSVAININQKSAFRVAIASRLNVVELIFTISFKDPANVQLTIDSSDCLQALLEGIDMETYLQVCGILVPFILNIINGSLSHASVEYSPELYLALELLGYIINGSPSGSGQEFSSSFPSEIFSHVFPVLKNIILRTNDDQILQNGGEVFNNLLQRASGYFIDFKDPETKQPGIDSLLEVASKFLSPQLSDSAAMNCGLIVISLFENFQSYLNNDFFLHLLRATIARLVLAKEVVTIENLIMVFCKLVLNTSPEQVIDVLVNTKLSDASGQEKNGLELVLPIWFNSFEVTRGYEKIKQNILALGKIFTLGDERVANLIVDGDYIPYDGDLIITRSMAKTMPQKYTQIPAPQKILKLLAGELGFQCQQPDPNDYLPEKDEGDEDDGDWEDMDDIGVPNYDQLKGYVDSDDENDHEDNADQGIKDLLVQFFKECTSKNLGNFQKYYELLTDDEKTSITENIVF